LAILSAIEKISQAKILDEIDILQEELFEIFKQVIGIWMNIELILILFNLLLLLGELL
jgi:hypothetical protein